MTKEELRAVFEREFPVPGEYEYVTQTDTYCVKESELDHSDVYDMYAETDALSLAWKAFQRAYELFGGRK